MTKEKIKIDRIELQAIAGKIREYLVSENHISKSENDVNRDFIVCTIFEVLNWYFDIKD